MKNIIKQDQLRFQIKALFSYLCQIKKVIIISTPYVKNTIGGMPIVNNCPELSYLIK